MALNIQEVMDMGERARTSPGKAENYLEECRHRLSFEGLDLCTGCLMNVDIEHFHQLKELVQNLPVMLGTAKSTRD